MAYQKLFRRSYVDQLRNEIKESIGLDRYEAHVFPVDESKVLLTYQIQDTESLRGKLNPEDDIETAIALYEAYPNLKPLQAQDNAFWVTLAHTDDIFQYLQHRWPLKKEKPLSNQILHHWFSRQLMRHGLANLWWSVYLTIDEYAEDKYSLTRIFFLNQTFRTRVFGTSSLFRHREAAIGVLSFIKDHVENFSNMESQGRFIATHFNKLGAIKQLSALDRNFFYREMNHIFPELKKMKGIAKQAEEPEDDGAYELD